MKNKIQEEVFKYDWYPEMKRNFQAFMISTFIGCTSKRTFKKLGLSGWELKAFIFNDGHWYWSDKVLDEASVEVEKWLKTHHISEISDNLEIFREKSIVQIKKLIDSKGGKKIEVRKSLIIFSDILQQAASYIWSSHMLEHFLWKELKNRTGKYVKSDLDKFIGDAAFPEKKNCLEIMEEEMLAGVDLKKIKEKYSWMRSRDGFSRPYSLKELEEYGRNLKKHKKHAYPSVPKSLVGLYGEARELVYLRSRRTDVFYELLFLARPILKAVASKYKIKFSQLSNYSIVDLIAGRRKKYSKNVSCLFYKDQSVMSDNKIIIKDSSSSNNPEIRGMIAQMGRVRGIVKTVLNVRETAKVQKGDILVTYMTSPDFLQAMKKAAAFVTNEGGLTCHAAIIARELKKPCIIGTKIATKVLHDGDLVEVDANKGIVKIIKKAK